MTASVIIPTLNCGNAISKLVSNLLNQTAEAEIVIVDSCSDDNTLSELEKFGEKIKLITIPRESFDHGGTRDKAFRSSSGDIVLFLTQDAMPVDNTYVEKLLSVFEDERVAGAFGRQIASSCAPEYEKLTRQFNYPEMSRKWDRDDIPKYGVKAYFFSDVCSAYRRKAYEQAGGFDTPVKSNEDMLMAAKLLQNGHSLAYCAEAAVYHSHDLSLAEEFCRNAVMAEVMKQYSHRLKGTRCDSEGVKMVKYVMGELIAKGEIAQAALFTLHAGAKFLGNRAGKLKTEKAK